MTNTEIKQVLLKKDVTLLYHTNTVMTSISFLKNGGLLSRGFCDANHLPQTEQYTDMIDRKYNIFYDIFFDSIEIQRRTGISFYGPVLFVYNINVLDSISEGNIRITKLNPQKWNDTKCENERYFLNIDELSNAYNPDDFGQHITLKDQRTPLSFDYLKKIVLSDPKREDNSIFEKARSAIETIIKEKMINAPFVIRNYSYYNKFFETYNDNNKLLKHYSI